MMSRVLAFALAALTTYLGIALLRRAWAHGLILDVPNERSSHDEPILRGAGVAVVGCVLGLLMAGNALHRLIDWRTFVIFTAGAGFVALISWLDDVHNLSNTARLLAQAMAALNAMAVFGYWHDAVIPGLGMLHLGWYGLPITLLWVIGLSNSYNFIDGIDGLAASQAIASALLWTAVGLSVGAPTIVFAALIICGSCLGFLGHNWPPARIFLGDVGSIFLGYTFAMLSVFAGRQDPRLVPVAVMIFAPVILDTGFTFLRRLVTGQNVFQSHRTHLYQRMVISGSTHGRVSLIYFIATLVFGIVAVWWLG
jgi:UDP-N-acetylmuramyl pentapeptide phosphotransferase/UDP-N-acetylglucosamine-1-phosphate transferase